jgi:cobalt-precorrin 5A hydrolase/precorrin-3B C17-methyltransferase
VSSGPVSSGPEPKGRVTIVGLGPGDPDLCTPAATRALAEADDLVGYGPYLALVPVGRADQRRHASGNRHEGDRARHALALAASGRRVAVVSSGDPGVFAMAAAVLEAVHEASGGAGGASAVPAVDLAVVPGVTAATAAAALAGAPLGHDFCVISLSDNLKPWAVIEARLEAAAGADFVLALYNPTSTVRPWQLPRALEIVGRHRSPTTPVVVARDVARPDAALAVTTLGAVDVAGVDMRTVLLVGSSTTVAFEDGARTWVYTSRRYPDPG